MAIRSILVPLTGRGDMAGPLQMALGLGKRFGAAVETRYVAPDPRLTLPYMGEGISPGLVEGLMEAMEKEDAAPGARRRGQQWSRPARPSARRWPPPEGPVSR